MGNVFLKGLEKSLNFLFKKDTNPVIFIMSSLILLKI